MIKKRIPKSQVQASIHFYVIATSGSDAVHGFGRRGFYEDNQKMDGIFCGSSDVMQYVSGVRVLAEDALPTADTPKITEFKIQGVKGTVDDQQQKINVAGLPCNTDLTSLTAEVTCDPADAIVRFDPLKPSADDGQKKLEQGNALQTEDFSVPRICNVEYQGQINSYTVTVSTLSHAGDPATCTNDSVCKTCGMLLEEKWGHDLLAATCTEKAKCQRSGCSYTEPALGHDLSKATCTELARCQREGCDYAEGEALGHNLSKATSTEPAR